MNELKAEVTDKALVVRIASRDEVASAELFDRYAQELYGFLARRVGPVEAEDILQEVFLRTLYRASSFRGDSSVRTWIYSIARYTLLEKNRGRIPGQTFFDLTDIRPGPESIVLGEERSQTIIAALEQLSDRLAIVLELHRIDGFTHSEIAEVLEISTTTSRKRLERALEALNHTLVAAESSGSRHSSLESWRASLFDRVLTKEVSDDPTA